jgi:hypothetical protein
MSSLEKFNFEKLRVYQDALDFSEQIYKTSKRFPISPLAGLVRSPWFMVRRKKIIL